MNSIRRIFGFLMMALTLGAFALPAMAAQQAFSISVPAGPLASSPPTIQVVFTNKGSSNPNSLELDIQSGPLTINPNGATATVGTSTTVYTGVVAPNGKSVQFTNLAPVKNTATLTLSVTVSSVCPVQWFGHMWAGSPTSPSQTFTLVDSSGNPIDPVNGPFPTSGSGHNCSLSFVNQPHNALTNTQITNTDFNIPAGSNVTVNATIDGSPVNGVLVSAKSTACSISGSATTSGGTGATFNSLKSTSATTVTGCQLTATADGFTSALSNAFNIYANAGVLGCDSTNNTGGTINVLADQAFGPGDTVGSWGLVRSSTGGLNPDGSACIPVPYTFNVDTSNNTASFIVGDKFGQAHIAVEYTVVWAPVFVDAYPASYTAGLNLTAGWAPNYRPLIAWGPGLTNPPTYPGQYVPGLACVKDDPSLGFAALPFFPNADPFATSTYSQYQYKSAPGAAPDGQALVCVAQQGWTSYGASGGRTQVLFWNKFIDENDVSIKGP